MGSKLVVPIKQGEELNVGLTMMAGDEPMDLTGYNVRVMVKEVPLEGYPAVINKLLTTDSDVEDVGYIPFPELGQILIHLTKEDTSHHTGDYSLIIALEAENFFDIISSRACGNAIYRICEQ